ncbi:DUF1275 domain-containing protein [Tardiphaga alba]|uniref:DUF1275 domain-containing protein n=1 Tax=Tardiphaga alba TaxID=340268 RepID=A0ABX8AD32_9BRAD|nr:YoaK family protein [Tardiphaga alba]QUS41182.1 DUF1275 domain-containing protein [Tardiphaga alba]
MLTVKSNLALACALSALAGYVDGIGFIHLGGLFVSFMSGNSTRLGVMIAELDWPKALEALKLIGLFVLGAGLGNFVGYGRGKHRQWMLLLTEAALLFAGAIAYQLDAPDITIMAIVLAMGLENAMFQTDGTAGIALTYMTGTLVRIGQLLAVALQGGPRWAWIPNLLLWSAMVAGAVIGTLVYLRFALAAVWFAAGAALLIAAITALAAWRQPAR